MLRIHFPQGAEGTLLKRKWINPCVVLKGPYEVHKQTSNPNCLSIVKAIDVLYEGEVRKQCTMSNFVRVAR